jgi:hypothetical protein
MILADEACANCGTTEEIDEIEGGLCADCFRSMPMDGWYTAGSWDKIPDN